MSTYGPQGFIEPPAKPGTNHPRQSIDLSSHDRWGVGGRLLGDEQLRWLEVLLDEAFVIPGTRIRFGIDGIIGLVPGVGDVVAGMLSLIIPFAGWVRGVPYITLVRMLTNVSIGLVVGVVPIFGDAFDIFWKANHRNYALLTRSIAEPRRHSWRDWLFLLSLGMAISLVFLVPIALALWIVAKFSMWHPGH